MMYRHAVHAATMPRGTSKPDVFSDPDLQNWAPSRTYHVENYKLVLRFDEPNGEVFGDEVVTVKPFEPGFRKFYLNSAGLTIDRITLEPTHGGVVKLAFSTASSRLWVTLDRDYDATSTLYVRIIYHGFPRTGLFFVNPTKDYPNWPREVYSQGEPEFNHYWFPCWDYPNDMATSETVTTVPEGQSVVSNGKLVKVAHAAGETTYDWLESLPHSSYLTSIAVGPWRKITDHYEGKAVDYYVPRTVDEATARRSFGLTPDMMGFFSRAAGVDYPYEKYAQTTVHNFIFGGQENVSATTLSDSTLHDARADADYPSTSPVAHELGQHWFGDYVQGRDWANIWLNEGFATYLEALYTQHHEGNNAFRFEIYQDQLAEQEEERTSPRPIVDRQYGDPLDMFDAITHEKGAVVLDMLRYVVDGDKAASQEASQKEVLFRALHHYLVANGERPADTAALIAAIREDTGLELNWFFHEWVHMVGLPDYRVETDYDAAKQIERVSVAQMQHVDAKTPIFDMPIELAFYGGNGERKIIQVRDNLQRQEFKVPLEFVPQWVDFDPDDFIDKDVAFEKPLEALIAEAEKDPSMMSRLWAVQQLGKVAQTKTGVDARAEELKRVLNGNDFYGVRAAAATGLGELGTTGALAVLFSALTQADSRVRIAVVDALSDFATKPPVYQALVHMLNSDSSYAVEAAAARAIGKSHAPGSFEMLRAKVAAKPEVHVMEGALAGLAQTKDPRAAGILLAQAQPGVSELVRLSALAGLAEFKDLLERNHAQQLAAMVRAALDDPFLLVRMKGEQLAGEFALTQFESDVEKDLGAPLVMQRELAEKVIKRMDHPEK
ncbi:MAG TPA: M1 family metallopeptidase [Terriglobia bacterium]|nr:M1 family metallopeptidase [Terriglobia bacterium]